MARPKKEEEKIPFEKFKGICEKYFEDCEGKDVFPDEAGMKLALGLTTKKYRAYEDDEEYSDYLDECLLRRESWLSRRMVESRAAANGCMNALKQEKNGGYSEKAPEPVKEKKITVKVVGFEGVPGNGNNNSSANNN